MVRRPVEGEVHVHYSQIYVESDPESFGPGLTEAFAGQTSGLCGAAIPGALWLSTGLHTGSVGFTVEVHDEAPPVDPVWEEVVEVSFRPVSERSTLTQWAGEASWELELAEIDYRVRYCGRGMDQARRRDTRTSEEPQVDSYLLQFWPAPPGPDRVVRQTAEIAAYWHDYARQQPPPPTPEERAEAERQVREAQEQAERKRLLAAEQRRWGGRLPSEALRAVRGNVRGLLGFDADLVHTLDAVGPERQRGVALLAARRACAAAGLDSLDWVAAALTALDERRPLPPPFDDTAHMWETLQRDPDVPHRTVGQAIPPERPPFDPPEILGARLRAGTRVLAVTRAPDPQPAPRPKELGSAVAVPLSPLAQGLPQLPELPGLPDQPGLRHPPTDESAEYGVMVTMGPPDPSLRVSQPHMALPAVTGAAEADPLQAALDAVYAAVVTYGEDYQALLDEVRAACEGS
ncbi:hypothetical protein ACFW9L_01455 [Streptomyces sp. NPDC059517]|uniref:hypothetical protein n=1 Tax=Streptomyces sp. NPDC059517 TaxID=3346855 RepID=UPI0036B65DB9